MWEGWREVLGPRENWRAEEVQLRELDRERILAVMQFSGRGKASGLDVAQVRGKGANVFQIRGGKVIKLAIYWDIERALADLGLEE